MEAQTPAEGILKVSENQSSITYHVECECTDPDHSQILEVEADSDGYISIQIWTKISNDHRRNRFSLMWEALTRGYVTADTSIILKEQAALNYAETLKKAIEDLKKLNATDN